VPLGSKPGSVTYHFIKRLADIIISVPAMIILSPFFIYAAIRILLSSPGPVLYRQDRVGYRRRKFLMLKFRSMYADAETNGPQLSTKNDARITRWGKKMRKWKLDELPQLWNVLKGEMSLVGPRPEREYYIKQIDGFERLLVVKPGVTSMGMIQFGYAENVDEISRRMKYDLQYIEQRSLLMDLKIILQTIRLVLRAKGR
jgi:polysaccharide biosynthesis protein PslA